MRSLVSNRRSIKAHPFFPNGQGDASKEAVFLTRSNSNWGGAFRHVGIRGQGTYHIGVTADWCPGLVEDPHASPAWDEHKGAGKEEGGSDL